MSMLTLNGVLQNVFSKPSSTDRTTGEVRPAAEYAQILAENVLQTGEKRLDMVTLKVHQAEAFRKLLGQFVRVPIGAFVANGQIQYYSLKTEALPITVKAAAQ